MLKNAKHEHFAQLVSNGESPTRAYVLAGYSKNGAKQSASTLLTKTDVSTRVTDLRKEKEKLHSESVAKVVEDAGIDKAWVMAKLVKVVELGMKGETLQDNEGVVVGEGSPENLNAANKALELIGKEFAMFVDRSEVRTGPLDGLEHDDLKALGEAIAGIQAGAAIPQDANSTRH